MGIFYTKAKSMVHNATIGRKILIICLALVILPTLVLGYVAYTSASSAINDDIEMSLKLQVDDIKDTSDSVFTLTQNKVNADLNVLRSLFFEKGSASIKDGKMVLGGSYVVNNNFEIVDAVQNMVGGTATIFQRQGDKAVRISTNVIGEDGKRAVGTSVSDAVYDTVINKGQTYYGSANVVGKDYITAYEPIKNAGGEIIGILYVGVDEEATIGILKDQIKAKKIGERGYVYILDSSGKFILHPDSEGENVSDLPFTQEILRTKDGVITYTWEGEGKIAAFTYFEPLDWYIVASGIMSDFTGPITQIGTTIILVMIAGILGGSYIAYIFGRSISRRMELLVNLAHKIRDGDLSARNIDDKQNDEIGILARAFGEVGSTCHNFRDEVGAISAAAIKGNLSIRGDSSRFHGDYAMIVEGFNDTLDAMINPVKEAMRLSGQYAAGDFTARMDSNLKYSGDFIAFRDALNTIGEDVSRALVAVQSMINELDSDISRIAKNVGEVFNETAQAEKSIHDVSEGTGQVAKIAAAVNQLADQSAQTTQQILTAMQDLSTTVASVAGKMEQVTFLTDSAAELSGRGKEVAGRAEEGMAGILRSSKDIEQMIQDISNQMGEIGRIVDIIGSISEQTNLLALNAAIEAARAGQAGLGFAVVAGEVKELANESQKSAENIAGIILTLQQKTATITNAVHNSLDEVNMGNESVSETLSLFNEIVGYITDINKNMNEVAAASEEQAASVEEVTATVNEFSDMIEQTTRESIGLAAASEESSAAVDQIVMMVGQVNDSMSEINKIVDESEESVSSISTEMGKFKA